MADFRRSIPALAVLFLLLGTAAFAQAPPNAALQCTANAGVPPLLRAEGLTELTGDLVLNCTGGVPTPVGQTVPQANIQVFLNTNVTSRLLGNTTEALLMIDEPQPANQVVCGSANTSSLNGGLNGCTVTGTGTGQGTYNGAAQVTTGSGSSLVVVTPARVNVFQSQLSGNQSVLFLGVPIDPPGSVGTRVIRITNVRANASAVAPGGSGTPGQVLALISASPQNILPINNPQQIVGYVQPGLAFQVRNAASSGTQSVQNFGQCNNINTTTSGARTTGFTLRFTEGFATAFKTRSATFDPTGATVPAPNPQAIPGQILTIVPPATTPSPTSITASSESGFYNPAFPTPLNTAGLADFGTRLQAVFNNIPTGSTLFVTTRELTATSSPTAHATLVQSDTAPFLAANNTVVGTGTFTANGVTVLAAQLVPVSGSATATWEITSSNALILENLDFGVAVSASANPTNNTPQVGVTTTVAGRFAPSVPAQPNTASASAPIPRFVDTSSASNLFRFNLCVTNILFPFLTNAPGFDSGIAIANTSKDPFGTGLQSGPCVISFYGDNAPTGTVSLNGTSSTGAALSIAAGTVAAVPLSTAAPNFTGYAIAQCNFQYAHGFAFISDLGVRNFAEGYLALIIPDGARGNTNGSPNVITLVGGQNDEVLGQ